MSNKHKQLRAEINREVRARAWESGKYALVWGQAYKKLYDRSGFRPPRHAKNRLDSVQAAGHLPTLLSVLRDMG